MHVSRVEISNFLGFRDLQMNLDANLQLVAGPNNAGKSSFVDLLQVFFSDPDSERLESMLPLNEYFESMGPRTLSKIQVWFADLTAEEVEEFVAVTRRDGQFWVELRCTRKGSVSFQTSRSPGVDAARSYYLRVIERFHFVKVPTIRLAAESDAADPSLGRLYKTLESVLVRAGNTRSTKLQTRFMTALQGVEAVVAEVLDASAAALADDLPFKEGRIRFELPDGRHSLRGILESTEVVSEGSVRLPVRNRGTGFQSALALGILRFVANEEASTSANVLFAIEEPEAFLHPQTQRALARIIHSLAEQSQVLVTTHSPTIVDSFMIGSISRLPLDSSGLVHKWVRPAVDDTTEGRLSRYCTATNSELVFANAVVFVEGEGDYFAVECLLDRICEGVGAHYALGISVIAADGLDKIAHLVELAEHFGVRSYVLADFDGLKKLGNNRSLFKILDERGAGVPPESKELLRRISDETVSTESEARKRQEALNMILRDYRAFVMASDLEGLLLSMHGVQGIVATLGSDGECEIDDVFADELLRDQHAGYLSLQKWMGSKGWSDSAKPTRKLKPHLVAPLVQSYLESHRKPEKNLRPLYEWLEAIVEEAEPNRM